MACWWGRIIRSLGRGLERRSMGEFGVGMGGCRGALFRQGRGLIRLGLG